MENIVRLKELQVKGKRVLVRVDFNVPLDPGGHVLDNSRIKAAIPTIKYLIDQEAIVILISHLGRPKGEHNLKYSLKPVAKELSKLIEQPVMFLEDCVGPQIEKNCLSLEKGSVVLLENLRFHKGETENDPLFSQSLSNLADVYVNDAFGTAHRAHASTVGVAQLLPLRAAGFLVDQELEFLIDKLKSPKRPFTVILGGAKVSDKIKVIDALMDKADIMLIGGAMAYTFALAQGKTIGNSLVEKDKLDIATKVLKKASAKNVKLLLPIDNLITDHLNFDERTLGNTKIIEGNIPEGWEGVDIGPKTQELFNKEIATSQTIVWNGPMGVFEIKQASQGTFAIAKAVADSSGLSIVGGGDSVSAIIQSGFADKISFMSTGGGASLKLLEGEQLPGISVLKK